MQTIPTCINVYAAWNEIVLPDDIRNAYLAMMPLRVRRTVDRYRRWQDRQATLLGKVLLLKALLDTFGASGLAMFQALEVAGNGKPFIPGEVEFNISHSDGMVVVAMARSGRVGIDIEKIRDVDVAEFSGHLPELANLPGNYDDDHVNLLFFDCWTRKEAVLKASGRGLSTPLEQVKLAGDTAILHGAVWHVKNLFIEKGYCCHVASDRPLEHITVEYVDVMKEWS